MDGYFLRGGALDLACLSLREPAHHALRNVICASRSAQRSGLAERCDFGSWWVPNVLGMGGNDAPGAGRRYSALECLLKAVDISPRLSFVCFFFCHRSGGGTATMRSARPMTFISGSPLGPAGFLSQKNNNRLI